MDSCFTDIIVEFLAVAFHNILYYAEVYPTSVFQTRKKYGVVIYRCCHPEVNEYINMCLKSIVVCLENGQLHRIEFTITNNVYEPQLKIVFDVDKCTDIDDTSDAYLIQVEQNLRAFCLKLNSLSSKFKGLPQDRSFIINLHTTESAAVAIACNPDLEHFPLTEVNKSEEMDKILPLRRFSIRSYGLDTYIEFK